MEKRKGERRKKMPMTMRIFVSSPEKTDNGDIQAPVLPLGLSFACQFFLFKPCPHTSSLSA
jgi:hypothetical protein